MSEFKIGDVVELKSGSPAMTVRGKDGENLDLVWFSEAGDEFRNESASPRLLNLVKSAD